MSLKREAIAKNESSIGKRSERNKKGQGKVYNKFGKKKKEAIHPKDPKRGKKKKRRRAAKLKL